MSNELPVTAGSDRLPRAHFVTHRIDRVWMRADPCKARIGNRARKRRVFREKTVAGVDVSRAGATRDL